MNVNSLESSFTPMDKNTTQATTSKSKSQQHREVVCYVVRACICISVCLCVCLCFCERVWVCEFGWTLYLGLVLELNVGMIMLNTC